MPATLKAATRPIEPDVLRILKMLQWDNGQCRIVGQLARPLYEQVNKVLVAAGGKWDRKAKAHVFADLDGEITIRESIAAGVYIDQKKAFQFFETPLEVARLLCQKADEQYLLGTKNFAKDKRDAARKAASVIDPSCGTGNLLAVMWELGYGAGRMGGHDINDKYLQKLKKRLPGVGVSQCDFLQLNGPGPKPEDHFDIVAMNPPFSQLLDVKHVTHALKWLKPETGVLVAIMSPAWTYRKTRVVEEFEHALRNYNTSWELLPEGSFKESGTGVRTGILTVVHKLP